MSEALNGLLGTDKSSNFTIKEHFLRTSHTGRSSCIAYYLHNCGYYYIRYATPVYKASTLILVKGDPNNGGAPKTEDLIRTALDGGPDPTTLTTKYSY
jgi:hypothetical protein